MVFRNLSSCACPRSPLQNPSQFAYSCLTPLRVKILFNEPSCFLPKISSVSPNVDSTVRLQNICSRVPKTLSTLACTIWTRQWVVQRVVGGLSVRSARHLSFFVQQVALVTTLIVPSITTIISYSQEVSSYSSTISLYLHSRIHKCAGSQVPRALSAWPAARQGSVQKPREPIIPMLPVERTILVPPLPVQPTTRLIIPELPQESDKGESKPKLPCLQAAKQPQGSEDPSERLCRTPTGVSVPRPSYWNDADGAKQLPNQRGESFQNRSNTKAAAVLGRHLNRLGESAAPWISPPLSNRGSRQPVFNSVGRNTFEQPPKSGYEQFSSRMVERMRQTSFLQPVPPDSLPRHYAEQSWQREAEPLCVDVSGFCRKPTSGDGRNVQQQNGRQ